MRTTVVAAAAGIALLAYFSLWPVDIAPAGWEPPAMAPSTAVAKGSLASIEHIGLNQGTGPEGISLDASGRVYAGYRDGRVVRFSADGRHLEVLANTKGRPWGTYASEDGQSVLVADAIKGLLKIEHGAHGRLLQYDPVSKNVTVLMRGLHVANGVTLGPDESYILVSETLSYRVWRYWLKGSKAGQKEIFIDNLPGFPDNISFNGRDGYWLALYAPRDRILDALLPHPALLKAAYRIPQALQPKAKKCREGAYVAHCL
jgi:sugar lactone lactonase YvrE